MRRRIPATLEAGPVDRSTSSAVRGGRSASSTADSTRGFPNHRHTLLAPGSTGSTSGEHQRSDLALQVIEGEVDVVQEIEVIEFGESVAVLGGTVLGSALSHFGGPRPTSRAGPAAARR